MDASHEARGLLLLAILVWGTFSVLLGLLVHDLRAARRRPH